MIRNVVENHSKKLQQQTQCVRHTATASYTATASVRDWSDILLKNGVRRFFERYSGKPDGVAGTPPKKIKKIKKIYLKFL